MKENFPKELIFDVPIDEELEFTKIRTIFEKYKAINRFQPVSYETLIQEDIINEAIFRKMIRKEYIKRYKGKLYYDKRMESIQYRRHIRNLRFMIFGSIIIYVIFCAMFIKELL